MIMPSGGTRKGAGRRPGCGKFGEKTKPIRIPESMINPVLSYISNQCYQLPLYASSVSAGFPSPADDHIDIKLDLNEHLIRHPAATYFVRVQGDSMKNAGIQDGDLLVVDRSLEPQNGKVVIAVLNGELTVKRLHKTKGKIMLVPENDRYAPIEITSEHELIIWGVVTTVIHTV